MNPQSPAPHVASRAHPAEYLAARKAGHDHERMRSADICTTNIAFRTGLAALALLGLAYMPPAKAAQEAYQNVILDQEPYSFYRLNESEGATAIDISGNERDGTYVGSPTFGIAGAGGTGTDNAVGFNGTNQYMTIPAANTLGSALRNVTFESIFSTTSTGNTRLFGTLNTGSTTGIIADINHAANQHRLFIRAEPSGGTRDIQAVFTNSDLTNGEFNHLIWTVDLSAPLANRIKAYVNGVPQNVTVFSDNTAASSAHTFVDFQNDFVVGALNNRGTIQNFFDGVIDEFVIYDHTLTAADAADHYASISMIATDPPRITSFSYDPSNGAAEATIQHAEPNTRFKLVGSATLDFSNPDQDPVPLLGAAVGTLTDGFYIITDENGVATVQFNLGTGHANFVRAEATGTITIAEFDFENDGQGFIPSGDWEWGTPASDNELPGGEVAGGNEGSTGAWATNLGDGGPPVSGGITPAMDSILRSPDIDLAGITGAQLAFAAAVDAAPGDTLEILVRDAADDALLQTINPFPDGFPTDTQWQNLGPFALSQDTDERTIYLEFRYFGNDPEYLGFYLDDVEVGF